MSIGGDEYFQRPKVSSFATKMFASICERNKMKKFVDSASFEGMVVSDFLALLEGAMALPDSLSLLFWILEKYPQFATQC